MSSLNSGILHTEHKFYVGRYELVIYDTHSTTYQSEKTQVGNALHIRKTPYVGSPVETQQMILRDQLGSVDVVTGSVGETLINYAYEPFGARRNSIALTGNITAAQLNDLFTKTEVLPAQGYTGHEHLDRTGFIHMNGRVYDPKLGRFLSPDPFVQAPANSQSWNRYSYVFNNPLKYTDPSGYQAKAGATEETLVEGKGCEERCQREGWAQVFHSTFYGVNTSTANWANAGGMMYNIADIQGMTLFALAQGTPPGGGDKTSTNTVLGVLAGAAMTDTSQERTWGSYLPGTETGASAQSHWADQVVASGGGFMDNPGAYTGLIFSSMWTDETAGEVAFTLGTAGTGALLANAGYALKFFRYPNAGGAGLNLYKDNVRKFAIDFHKFEYKGIEKARLHYHRGETKSQMKKHRPYQGGL